MATQHLDLEEQEQLANLKFFWQKNGLWITTFVIALSLSYLGWSGWQWHQNNQSQKSAVLFDEFTKTLTVGDAVQSERVLSDMKNQFGSTAFTAQAALLSAKFSIEKGQVETAKKALAWLVESSADVAYKDIAKLRLAGLHADTKNYDQAIQLLAKNVAPAFEPLANDRLGDIYALKGSADEAKVYYLKAYQGMAQDNEYRKLIEVKLARWGVDPANIEQPKNK